jgi:hypothetical protein
MVFFKEIYDFLHRTSTGLFGANIAISILKHLSCRKYSFEKLTQFSQGKNVPDVPASNTYGFLLRDTCVSSTPLNRHVWKKMSLFIT